MATFSEAEIARESIRRFFSAIASERFFVAISTGGSLVVGLLSGTFGTTPVSRIVLWCALVAGSEFALTAIDGRFKRRPPPEPRYYSWAWAKTAITAAHGLAWGLGVILLHRHDAWVTTLAPAWAMLIFTAGLVYSCASFLPCIIAATFAAIAPPTLWLVAIGTGIDRSVAICLAASLPALSMIGVFAARNARKAVIAQLEIASLLAKAQEAQRERARFYSSASHDLRQPVHALGFYVSLLPAVSDAKERREIEGRLDECATSLDRQFNAILGVADADRAVERARPRVFALQPILEAVATSIVPEATRKNLHVRVVRSSLSILADADLLERVALNLAVNAVRYTSIGGVLIGARHAGQTVRLCIVDTGIGIAASECDRIFDDFYQVGNRERARDKGFGLGLSIVRRLCVAMDWGLELSSVPGRGSQFVVSLPRAPTIRVPTATSVPAEPQGVLAAALVVLVVDDDPLVCDATARLLAQWDVRIELAASGAPALAALARRQAGEHWHVLLDYRLAGGEDGLSLAQRLRAAAVIPLRITMMSGDITDEIVQRCAAIGIPVLRKPMKPIRLRALLSSPWDERGAALRDP